MEAIKTQLWWIIGLPLAGFLFQSLVGGAIVKRFGDKGKSFCGWMAFLPIFAAFMIAVGVTRSLAGMEEGARQVVSVLFDWIKVYGLSVPFESRADTLSMTMTLVVTGVGSLIHMYAIKYMAADKDFTRFFTYLNLFIAFMLLLVLGNNLAMLFIGWEGVGVCSYLLIGFWYKDLANAKAANKAFITNRVGDWGLTLGIFLIAVVAASTFAGKPGFGDNWLSFDVLLGHFNEMVRLHPGLMFLAALFLFIGAMGKSAQFPLYVWLPDAMAGPTPVSALIHAATMVTAGVYLLNRMSPLFSLVPAAQVVVVIVGALTALVGALIAFGQTDIKKVLAYSTVSQLGYMFIACGVGAYWAGIFHVVTHAFFKALLFLGSGAVIYAMSHNQDMRNYGGLKKYIKVTFATMFIGWAAIAGIPFLFAGAYSKEAILGAAVNVSDDGANTMLAMVAPWAGWLGFLVAMLTAAYMTRMMMLTFAGSAERWRAIPATAHHPHHGSHAHHAEAHADPHGFFYSDEEWANRHEEHEHHHDLTAEHQPKEVPWEMSLPLVVLAVLALGASGWFLEHNLFEWLYPMEKGAEHGHFGTTLLLMIGSGAALVGILYGYFTYRKPLSEREGWDMAKWSPFRRSANKQFGFDALFADGSVAASGVIGTVLSWIDRNIVDGIVNGVGVIVRGLAGTGKWFQTGFVRSYALVMEIGIVAFIVYVLTVWIFGGNL